MTAAPLCRPPCYRRMWIDSVDRLPALAAAMGIDWTVRAEEISQAIPPAYTEWIGRQLLGALAR